MNTPPANRLDKIKVIQKLYNNMDIKNFERNYSIKQPKSFIGGDLKSGYTQDELESKENNDLDKILAQFSEYKKYFQLEEEKKAFYNQPRAEANFEYWVKQAYWTIDEGIALILGKNPRIVNWDSIGRYSSPFINKFKEIREISERYLEENILLSKLPPATFLDWVEKIGYEIPAELSSLVNTQSLQGTDWHSCFLRELEKNKKKDKRIESMHTEIESLKKQTETVSSKSERGLLNIIGVLKNTLISTPIDQGLFKSQAELIDFLVDRYPLTPGISKSNLENKFSRSKEHIEQK
ncbi:hypothetical protein [Legionella septentrionalis]|uniref:Uncharacterized protein n=1 Tax=Legionella septentrionalis TaxID=2498109 RepID=A0A3S0WZM3_9GAMM|nr:hypothetical protein [Legionella septentrionalis]RUQ84481.1 hypothetical protein EKM59_08510 [Legionella septentrionalis]